uniref:Uncharacterized protein n=1 Tax=Iridovirus LCIVAC01 TaxID=2506607 RepID=A0A481YPW2_9VIRU|nr:MAG: hypothetical protein LCIVAC01_01220 [Iridovirus LCIVAC01]
MDYTKYQDPENSSELIEQLRKLPAGEELINSINSVYPSWIVQIIDNYSRDYPHLIKNWDTICKLTYSQPEKILLVDTLWYDAIAVNRKCKYELLKTACDILTKKGYCVRRQGEFVACEKCGKALVSFGLFVVMKEKNLPVPETWAETCSEC